MCVLSISDAPWTVLLANIEPESTGVTIGGLIPARSYQFRLCAVNDVGRGQFSKETDRWVLHLAVIHLLNVKNIARRLCFLMCTLAARQALHFGGLLLFWNKPFFPARLGSSIENPVIISCKSTFWSSFLWEWGRDEPASGWAFSR